MSAYELLARAEPVVPTATCSNDLKEQQLSQKEDLPMSDNKDQLLNGLSINTPLI